MTNLCKLFDEEHIYESGTWWEGVAMDESMLCKWNDDDGYILVKIRDSRIKRLKEHRITTEELAFAKVRAEKYIEDFKEVHRKNAWEYECRLMIYTTSETKPNMTEIVKARNH